MSFLSQGKNSHYLIKKIGARYTIFVLLLFIFCFFVRASSADNRHTVLTIRVGAYENQPKIYTDESGGIVGLFPDVLSYIAEKEGWKINYLKGSWSQCLERLEKNEIDLMVDVAYSQERAQKYLFSRETFLVNWATVYTERRQGIESLVDLNGKKIAVMKGSIHTEGSQGIKQLAKKFDISCEFVEVENYQKVFELLSNEEADAGVVNRIFGSLFSDEYDVIETPILFNPRELKFAFPRQSSLAPLLIEKIDHHLGVLKNDPDSIYSQALYVYLSGLPRELIYSPPEKGPSGKPIALTPSEKAWIQNHPVIRLGIDPEFAPFEYIDSEGVYQGIASDYIKLLNQRLGLNMTVTGSLTWKQAVEAAQKREVDVLPCIGVTRARKAFLRFSKPYIDFFRVVITRSDTPFLTGLKDIKNKKVAVQRNSSHEGYLHDHTAIEPIGFDTLQDALLSVSNGQTDAFVGNLSSSTYWIRKLNLTNLKVAAPVSSKIESLYFGVRKDWPELVKILNKGLASIGKEEETRIRKRWVDIEYKPGISRRVLWRHTLQIGMGALAILLVILFWNYRLKNEIEKRIQIEDSLFEANKELKKLDRLKSMFIASMSHELRTPLNSIIGFTGVILQGMTGPLNEKQQDHLNRVYHSAKHLLALITDVIDISKIEAGRIEIFPQEFILSDVVDEAVMTIQPQLKEKKLKLEMSVEENLELYTDRKRLLQCIINYLSNGVKYTEDGTIKIAARQVGEKVEVLVSDTGIGFSEKDKARLFEAFERLESHLRVKAGGTGLGLYLTRKLATEILGGDVLVQSREGKGSTFGLMIPSRIETPENQHNKNGDNA